MFKYFTLFVFKLSRFENTFFGVPRRYSVFLKLNANNLHLPVGTNKVAINANPDNIIQPQRMLFLPQRFRVKIRNVYAGTSTTPDITKLT